MTMLTNLPGMMISYDFPLALVAAALLALAAAGLGLSLERRPRALRHESHATPVVPTAAAA